MMCDCGRMCLLILEKMENMPYLHMLLIVPAIAQQTKVYKISLRNLSSNTVKMQHSQNAMRETAETE